MAVDEAVVKRFGHAEYVWAAVDADSGEILEVYASRDRSLGQGPDIPTESPKDLVVDRGPWYPWALKRISYLHQTFGERNRVERWFRTLNDSTTRLWRE